MQDNGSRRGNHADGRSAHRILCLQAVTYTCDSLTCSASLVIDEFPERTNAASSGRHLNSGAHEERHEIERVAYGIVAATMLLNFAVWLLTPHYLDATILEPIEPKPLLHPALNLALWLSLAVLVIALWAIFDVPAKWLLMPLGAGYVAIFISGMLIQINTWKVHGPRQTVSATVFAIEKEKSGRYSKLHVKSIFVDRDGVEKKLWVPMAMQLQLTADRRKLALPLCDGWLGTRFVCLNDPLFD